MLAPSDGLVVGTPATGNVTSAGLTLKSLMAGFGDGRASMVKEPGVPGWLGTPMWAEVGPGLGSPHTASALLRACLAALGGSALPVAEVGPQCSQPLPWMLELARASRVRSRRFHRL